MMTNVRYVVSALGTFIFQGYPREYYRGTRTAVLSRYVGTAPVLVRSRVPSTVPCAGEATHNSQQPTVCGKGNTQKFPAPYRACGRQHLFPSIVLYAGMATNKFPVPQWCREQIPILYRLRTEIPQVRDSCCLVGASRLMQFESRNWTEKILKCTSRCIYFLLLILWTQNCV